MRECVAGELIAAVTEAVCQGFVLLLCIEGAITETILNAGLVAAPVDAGVDRAAILIARTEAFFAEACDKLVAASLLDTAAIVVGAATAYALTDGHVRVGGFRLCVPYTKLGTRRVIVIAAL